jgi:hypothetical protein
MITLDRDNDMRRVRGKPAFFGGEGELCLEERRAKSVGRRAESIELKAWGEVREEVVQFKVVVKN